MALAPSFFVVDTEAASDGADTPDPNAPGNTTPDAATYIGDALAEARTAVKIPGATGNVVFLPAGVYYLKSGGVSVPGGVTFMGAGWNRPGALKPLSGLCGTWIITEAGANFSPVTISGAGGAVRNIAFAVAGQGAAPVPDGYPVFPAEGPAATIHIQQDGALVEDVFMLNPYGGVFIDGVAQATIRRLFGQPLQYGIKIDGSEDTNYIDSVHFWTFWQGVKAPSQDQLAYQMKFGRALDLYRCDNPHLSNIFTSNYDRGLSLSESSRPQKPGDTTRPIPHKVHLVNADFDSTTTGVYLGAAGSATDLTHLQMVNVTMQAPGSGGNDNPGLWVDKPAAHALIQASNIRICNSTGAAIQIDADNVDFYGENVALQQWQGKAGVYVSNPSSCAIFGAGFSAIGRTPYGGPGQFLFAQTGKTPTSR